MLHPSGSIPNSLPMPGGGVIVVQTVGSLAAHTIHTVNNPPRSKRINILNNDWDLKYIVRTYIWICLNRLERIMFMK